MQIDGEYFDCRIYYEGKRIELGTVVRVSAIFLSPDTVLKKLVRNMEISLWEGKAIARGTVIETY